LQIALANICCAAHVEHFIGADIKWRILIRAERETDRQTDRQREREKERERKKRARIERPQE